MQTEGFEEIVISDLPEVLPKSFGLLLFLCLAIEGLLLPRCIFELPLLVLFHLILPFWAQFLPKLCRVFALRLIGVDLTSPVRG
jgi:hypothetical protein